MQKFGLLEQRIQSPKDWYADQITGAIKEVMRDNGNYSDLLPGNEYQKAVSFDTMACVSFSALNCLETIANFKGMSWNKSDRFTAKMSGTGKQGNYFRNVAESLRLDGVVDESIWPFPRTQKTPAFKWEDFYSAVPGEIVAAGKSFLNDWGIQWEWQDVGALREALRFGPVQVSVYAWPKPGASGLYTDAGVTKRNHAVELFNATEDYYEIFDHYDATRKKLAPNYRFGAALQFSILKNQPMPPTPLVIPDNYLVQLVDHPGGFAVHLAGKLIVDDLAKIEATFISRNDGDLKGKIVRVKKADWDMFPKVNLKNEPVA